jgi:hypothetical protein
MTSMAGIDTTLKAGSDSITVTSVQLFNGGSKLIRQEGSSAIPLGPSVVKFSSVSNSSSRRTGDTQPLRNGYRSPQLAGVYQELDFHIDQVPDTLKDQINANFYDGGNYSLLIKGKYDGSEFTFKSEHNFHETLSQFTPVTLPEQNSGVAFIVHADIKSWFLDKNGDGFLDPSDSQNMSAINVNIHGSFQVKPCGSVSGDANIKPCNQ